MVPVSLPHTVWPLVVTLVVAFLAAKFAPRQHTNRKKLPSGPKGWPFLGNLFDIPRSEAWHVFNGWAKQYGDVVYLHVLGRPIILLNSMQACNDLFDGRFTVYSDRPNFPLANLIGHHWNFGFMPYGKEWRSLRRIFTDNYAVASALTRFHDQHRQASASFLNHVLESPEKWADHIRLRAGQLIVGATYGIPVQSREDPLIRTAEAVMDVTSIALSPAMWLVNPISMLQSIPVWLGLSKAPGLGTSNIPGLNRWRADLEELRMKPFYFAKDAFSKGLGRNSYVAALLADGTTDDRLIHDTAAVAYGAGYETTVISGDVFVLAMTLFPAAQKRAQEEIDRVVGGDRLPDYSDRDRLSYVSALTKEVLRWHPPAPTGIPHMLREDDDYRGFHIPKSAVVMGNIWGILHDPEVYPEPERFMPERFIKDGAFDCSANDPSRVAFGFGRRMCPGRLFSEDSIWLMVAQFLSVFDVSAVDPQSPPKAHFTGGATPRPQPFACVIRPRSAAAVELVECSARD